ncbi:M12 family metallo-peptidase [uncultured Flavobacterium sp.]|uniref:M12 family metallo-peptidase n=1 Tax=uncultured Flavobacterium sp. TaxID=165435 RepID=UPI0025932993|nr:M12 family metallo-peptidase [uncultured Flavobacterium sp.]
MKILTLIMVFALSAIAQAETVTLHIINPVNKYSENRKTALRVFRKVKARTKTETGFIDLKLGKYQEVKMRKDWNYSLNWKLENPIYTESDRLLTILERYTDKNPSKQDIVTFLIPTKLASASGATNKTCIKNKTYQPITFLTFQTWKDLTDPDSPNIAIWLHELGHNWGATHDYQNNKSLMTPYAGMGDAFFNGKHTPTYSTYSINQINNCFK